MPIIPDYKPRNLSKTEFDERDAVVMACAYASQNELGRLCDEHNYEKDVAARLRAAGFVNVRTQVPIQLTHGAFKKEYRIDLLADDAMYELKAVAALRPEHDVQALNYAMMLDVSHSKLINFREERVKGLLRFNAISAADRYGFVIDDTAWLPQQSECVTIRELATRILEDWGAYLDFRLYEQAIIFHLGGDEKVVDQTQISRDGIDLGAMRFTRYSDYTCFAITGHAERVPQRSHLMRRLQLSPYRTMQWINFRHRNVTFETIFKKLTDE